VWGPGVSESKEKENEREAGRRGEKDGGLLGRLGRKVRRVCLLFLTPFKTTFLFQIQIKFFQTFSQKFYKLFRNHTSNQKPCKPTDDAQSLVVSMFIKLCLIF
jgi:hypothetical protein